MKTASYSCKGFVKGSSIKWIILISQLSLIAIIPLILLGLHPLLVTAIFLAAIFFGFNLVTGDVVYSIDEEGLTKEVSPKMMKKFWQNQTFKFYSWDQIESFRSGTDASRSLQEFDYLTIKTARDGKLEINTKKGDRNTFKEFESVFRYYVGEAAQGNAVDPLRQASAKLAEELPGSVDMDRPTIQHTIVEKPSFYQTTTAKLLTIFFILMFVGLGVFMIAMGNARLTNIFRLFFIVLPGVIYMVWRVFLKKD